MAAISGTRFIPAVPSHATFAEARFELGRAAIDALELPSRMSGADLFASIVDADRDRFARALDSLLTVGGIIALPLRVPMRDGSLRDTDVRLRYGTGAFQFDVVDARAAGPGLASTDAALRRYVDPHHDRLALATLSTRDAIFEFDLERHTFEVSAQLAQLLGFDAVSVQLDVKDFHALLHPDDTVAERAARVEHIRSGARYDIDIRLRTSADDYRAFRMTGESLRDEGGKALRMAGTISDVDSSKFAERQMLEQRNELERLTRQLHEMSLRLVNAQEDERRHVGRELHDQTGQTLTAAILNLEFWRGKAVPADELDHVLAEVKSALREIRDLSLRLHPPMLSEAGLEAALRSYLDRQSASANLGVSLAVEGLDRLPAELEITAFRIVQEAVNNIVRHAEARHVDVSIGVSADEIAIRISDDGTGCIGHEAVSDAVGGTSLGLVGMNERALLLGGRCEFISMPGSSSIVLARIPFVARR